MVSMCHHMLYQFMLSTWSVCITICCPHDQYVSPYVAHMISMYHHMLPTWSRCLTICCINSCCLHDQHVSPYVASVHIVYMVSMSHHMLRQFILSACPHQWSVCLAIYTYRPRKPSYLDTQKLNHQTTP
jgi:hypothetical protein